MNRFGTQSSKWDCLPLDSDLPYIALSVADMDLACSPAIREAVASRADLGLYGYTDLPADHEDVVAEWLNSYHGWEVDPDSIVSAHRIVQVVPLLLAALTQPGDGAAIFTPSYSPLEKAVTLNDRVAVRVPLTLTRGGFSLDQEATIRAFEQSKMLLLISPHNPTAKVWTETELGWLAQQAAAHDLIIMSDDIHAAFAHEGHDHRFIAQFAEAKDRTYTMTSPAKAFNVPGLETTHVVVENPELRDILKDRLNRAGFHNPNFFSDAATRAAYQGSREWLEETKEFIDANLARLREFCTNTPGLRLIEPEGTFLALVDARDVSPREADLHTWWVERSHVVPSFGSDFGPEYEGFIRVNLATPPEALDEAFARLTENYPSHT